MSILAPLAERMRPMSLNEFQGQDHLLKEDASIRRAIDSGLIPSMIFWGPPGVGKTTLAHLIANHLKRQFFTLSAISSGVKDVREVIHKVESAGMFQQSGTILFIDEIHRFSKAQQDSLLGAVEKGIVTLIGATTENPSFEVISALLSRCQVYTLKEHSKESLLAILNKAITEDSLLQSKNIELKETNALLMISGGDARKLLNIFELIVGTFKDEDIIITDELVKEATQERVVNYDKDGDQHYDIISAFIKSIRGSDPNAAIYWLARMVEGGEDPKFIARRLIISASEDVGLANPNALLMANNCFNAIQAVGWPEARIILAQCVIYLAASPKGNAAYKAINEAQSRVRETGSLGIPLSLRNAPSKLMKELGYGDGYRYSHDYPENFADQEFLPDEIIGTSFYSAGSSTKEKEVQEKINKLWGAKYSK
jgi:putative ATPase